MLVNVCKQVNVKLFSIKRLSYLPFSMKLQFFKTFTLPLFDYCLSFICYYYFACLFKLFKFDLTFKLLDETYNFLQGYYLFVFINRVVLRLSLFAHKIINIKQ